MHVVALTDRLDAAGRFAPLLVVVMAVLLAALIPRSGLAAGAGLLFGAWAGAGYVMAGALLGAVLAFAIGRWLGRDFLDARRRAAALNSWLDCRGLLGVFVLRLLPIAPFGLISYAFGATRVRLRTFTAATLLGSHRARWCSPRWAPTRSHPAGPPSSSLRRQRSSSASAALSAQ